MTDIRSQALACRDAAHAVAEHVGGGSYKKFIDWMNEDAEKIGALRTHFSNPHGLPDPVNHFTTAYDLAMIADAGFKLPGFEQFVSTLRKERRKADETFIQEVVQRLDHLQLVIHEVETAAQQIFTAT